MNVTVKTRHMDVTDSIKTYLESKVAKLPRIYNSIQTVEATLGMEVDESVVEIVAHGRRKHVFVATSRNDDMYAAIDQCLDKVAQQIRRHKEKVRDRKGLPHGAAEKSSGG